jgi:hypothetical protein
MRIFIQHPSSVKISLGKEERKKEEERAQTEGNFTACFVEIMPIT